MLFITFWNTDVTQNLENLPLENNLFPKFFYDTEIKG